MPFKTRDTFLYHLTVKENWEIIKSMGYLEPRDPAPKHWAGMSAVFMSAPHDPWFEENQRRVQKHVKEKGVEIAKLITRSRKNSFLRIVLPELALKYFSRDIHY